MSPILYGYAEIYSMRFQPLKEIIDMEITEHNISSLSTHAFFALMTSTQ